MNQIREELTSCPWESLPSWLRERYDQIGPDEMSTHGWDKLVSDPALPIEVRGLSLHWMGAGPNHGEEVAFRAPPPPDEPEFEEGDLEAWLRAGGEDIAMLRRLGLLSTPMSRADSADDTDERAVRASEW
jgi:hypothetical protein